MNTATLISAPHDTEHLQGDIAPMPDRWALHDIRDNWKNDLQVWTTLPEIILKHRRILFNYVEPGGQTALLHGCCFGSGESDPRDDSKD